MTVVRCEIRPGAYADSIVLMQLQSGLTGLPGVVDAGVVMGTPVNLDLLRANDLLPKEAAAAGPDDLVVVVKADSDTAAADALTQIDSLMARRSSGTGADFYPKSLAAAAKLMPDARWVLVSVPGRYAAEVAREALDLERNVFLYSDNVALEDEVNLKSHARSQGLMVMGPDCGTAIINGIGLGFANRVRRGTVGLVGASGTGLQAITSTIHELGAGVSHALGTGGRDLSQEVGAVSAHQALDLLGRDEETEVIVLVSKPPAPHVVSELLAAARGTGKPVIVDFFGYAPPTAELPGLTFATSLDEAAKLAVSLSKKGVQKTAQDTAGLPKGKHLRGLFAGGTLALEAQLALRPLLAPLYSNIPIEGIESLADPAKSLGHAILDLGADELTVGRLHPMIDPQLRIQRLRQEAEDPEVGVILLDVVLGEGSHSDPAAELAPVVDEIQRLREIEIVVVVIGTDEDPQELAAQIDRLTATGAMVFPTISDAVGHAASRFGAPAGENEKPVALEAINEPLAAINVGLETFYESLTTQGAQAIHVEWRPPAGGDDRLQSILEKMKA